MSKANEVEEKGNTVTCGLRERKKEQTRQALEKNHPLFGN